VIELTGLERHLSRHRPAVVLTTARAVEGDLRYRLQGTIAPVCVASPM
jgi:hypothetical protein